MIDQPHPVKVFDTGQARPAIPFAVRGIDESGVLWEEHFKAAGAAPGGTLLDVGRSVKLVDGKQVYDLTAVLGFFEQVLIPESLVRFDLLVRDAVRVVDLDHLGEIMQWLSEVYANLPSAASSTSAGGTAPSPATSTAGASSLPVLPPPPSTSGASAI